MIETARPTSFSPPDHQNQYQTRAASSAAFSRERFAYWTLSVLAIYSLVRSFAYAAFVPLWFDEILTAVVSRQRTISDIWAALKQGVDGSPPLFYLVEHFVSLLSKNDQLGYRLLSPLAFFCTLLLLFLFVKTRLGPWLALLSSALLLMTPVFFSYAKEARPYSLVTAFVVLSMVCYQRVPAAYPTFGLAVSLAFASLMHYYAVLAIVPFFVAEFCFSYFAKRIRFKVWIALLISVVPSLLSLPMLLSLRQSWGSHFWAHSTVKGLAATYGDFFKLGSAWGFAVCGLALWMVLVPLRVEALTGEKAQLEKIHLLAERILVAGLVALPSFGFILAKVAQGPFVARYFLSSVPAICIAAAFALRSARPATLAACGSFILVAFVAQEVGIWTVIKSNQRGDRRVGSTMAASVLDVPEASRYPDLPIVLSDVQQYVELWYYSAPAFSKRVFALADPPAAVIYYGADTADKIVLALQSYGATGVKDFSSFAPSHPKFLLYCDGSRANWWPARLAHDGYRLQLLSVDSHFAVYLAESPRSQ
jgi:hypothetical protein